MSRIRSTSKRIFSYLIIGFTSLLLAGISLIGIISLGEAKKDCMELPYCIWVIIGGIATSVAGLASWKIVYDNCKNKSDSSLSSHVFGAVSAVITILYAIPLSFISIILMMLLWYFSVVIYSFAIFHIGKSLAPRGAIAIRNWIRKEPPDEPELDFEEPKHPKLLTNTLSFVSVILAFVSIMAIFPLVLLTGYYGPFLESPARVLFILAFMLISVIVFLINRKLELTEEKKLAAAAAIISILILAVSCYRIWTP